MDCPHEPQFLPDVVFVHSVSIAVRRATRQAWPLTQSGVIQANLELEVVAKRLLLWGYGVDYSAAVLDQLKAWEAFPYGSAREPSYAYRGCHTPWVSPGLVP